MRKQQWLKSLKVGDCVIDCRLKKVRIKEVYEVKYLQYWFKRLLFWMPIKWFDRVDEVLAPYVGYLYDKVLVFEDGSECSAINCCEPVGFLL